MSHRKTDLGIPCRSKSAKVVLGHLGQSLDVTDAWGRRLSEGEKQRLSLARVLLAEPDLILLDEATSGLEESAERDLHHELRRRLPRAAILSASHDDHLRDIYNREIVLDPRGSQSLVGANLHQN
jgi:putative ATP-binding cassette transporter